MMPQRILIFGVDWMGDALFSTPVLRELRLKYPEAYIALAAHPRTRDVFKTNPHLNKMILFEEGLFLPGFFKHFKFLAQIKKEHFDTAIHIHRSRTRAFLSLLAGIPRRIGFEKSGLLTQRVKMPPKESVHRSAIYMSVLGPLGIDSRNLEPDIMYEPNDSVRPIDKPYAVVHAGGNWHLKRWPKRYFCEIIEFLNKRGILAVLCGTDREKELSEYIVRNCSGGSVISLCGRTSFASLAGLIKKSQFVLSNDSGPIHIAAGLGVPLIALYGPTSGVSTGPVSRGPKVILQKKLGCRIPCYFDACHDHACMEGLKPSLVIEALESHMQMGLSPEAAV